MLAAKGLPVVIVIVSTVGRVRSKENCYEPRITGGYLKSYCSGGRGRRIDDVSFRLLFPNQ